MSAIRKLKTVNDTYAMLQEYQELKQRMAALKAELDLVYDNLIDGYFEQHEKFEYEGRLIATYMPSIRHTFDKKSFEVDHPKLAKAYTVEQEYYTLRLK